jgi:FkbM family methyltransferase
MGTPPGNYTAPALNWRRVRELIVKAEGVGMVGRVGLALGYLTHRLPRRAAAVRFGHGRRVYLRGQTFSSDFETLREVFLPRRNAYRTDYRGAAVLDIGAHKGYLGAYALLRGARVVVSYEPETINFAFLERAARSFRNKGATWHTRRAAVGALPGRSVLHVSRESWTHSLVSVPQAGPAGEVGRMEVDVVGIADALADVAEQGRVVLKIDAEGSECEIVGALTPDLAATVDVLLVETHEFADCTADDLSKAIARLGLTPSATVDPAVVRFQR